MSEKAAKEQDLIAFALALASVVFGVMGGFHVFLSVVGIVLGLMALHEIKESLKPLIGRKLAIIGIIVSGITAVLHLIGLIWLCIFHH